MRTLFFSCLLLFNVQLTLSQESKIDSLKNLLKETKKINKRISLLDDLCKEITPDFNSAEDEKFILELLELAQKSNNKNKLINAYQYHSNFFIWRSELEKAIAKILEAKKIAHEIGHLEKQMECITQAGAIYTDLNDLTKAKNIFTEGEKIIKKSKVFNKYCSLYSSKAYYFIQQEEDENAIENYIKALNCLDSSNSIEKKDIETKVSCYDGLCWLYIDRKQYDKAKEYAFLALEELKEIKSEFYESIFNRIIARIYSDQNEMDKAIHYQHLALKYFIKSNHQVGIFDLTNKLSFSYWKINDFTKAKEYAIKASSVAKNLKMPIAINSSNFSMAKVLLSLNQTEKAEAILKETAKDTINKKNWPSYMKEDLLVEFYLLYKEKKDYRKALKYSKSLMQYRDSLNKARFDSQVINLETKYQTEQKENELAQQKIATQEQELLTQKANTRNWLLAIGLLAFGISAFFIWRRYKSEAKAKQIISEQKSQIEKLQKEFHHRLKNDFRSINSYISLVQRQFTDTNFKEPLNELKNRVTSMFKVHEMLLKEDDITQVKAHPYLLELSQNVEEKYRNENIKVICNVNATETIVADKAIPYGIVLNEFITNSYKYAFDEDGGEITIDFKSDNNNHYLSLKDNGKGLPEDFNIENLASLGMSIIPMFADLHDGSYKLDGSNGVSLTLTLPKKIA